MRTTLDIDEDVLRAARSLAKARGTSVGRALSQLARAGLKPQPVAQDDALFPTFPCRPDAPPVTTEMIREALDEW